MASRSRAINIGTDSRVAQNDVLPSPENLNISGVRVNFAANVPIGKRFDAESRYRELKGLGDGLEMWAKAQAEVETTNDDIQSRRMQEEYQQAIERISTDLQENPNTMNNPAVWTEQYNSRIGSAIAEINNKYRDSFYVQKNRMLTNERLGLMVKEGEHGISMTSAKKVSAMAKDATSAMMSTALENGDFATAEKLNQSGYFSPAEKYRHRQAIEGAKTDLVIMSAADSDPVGALTTLNETGSLEGRALTAKQMSQAQGVFLKVIKQRQQELHDSMMGDILYDPKGAAQKEEYIRNYLGEAYKNSQIDVKQYRSLLTTLNNVAKKELELFRPTDDMMGARLDRGRKLALSVAQGTLTPDELTVEMAKDVEEMKKENMPSEIIQRYKSIATGAITEHDNKVVTDTFRLLTGTQRDNTFRYKVKLQEDGQKLVLSEDEFKKWREEHPSQEVRLGELQRTESKSITFIDKETGETEERFVPVRYYAVESKEIDMGARYELSVNESKVANYVQAKIAAYKQANRGKEPTNEEKITWTKEGLSSYGLQGRLNLRTQHGTPEAVTKPTNNLANLHSQILMAWSPDGTPCIGLGSDKLEAWNNIVKKNHGVSPSLAIDLTPEDLDLVAGFISHGANTAYSVIQKKTDDIGDRNGLTSEQRSNVFDCLLQWMNENGRIRGGKYTKDQLKSMNESYEIRKAKEKLGQ